MEWSSCNLGMPGVYKRYLRRCNKSAKQTIWPQKTGIHKLEKYNWSDEYKMATTWLSKGMAMSSVYFTEATVLNAEKTSYNQSIQTTELVENKQNKWQNGALQATPSLLLLGPRPATWKPASICIYDGFLCVHILGRRGRKYGELELVTWKKDQKRILPPGYVGNMDSVALEFGISRVCLKHKSHAAQKQHKPVAETLAQHVFSQVAGKTSDQRNGLHWIQRFLVSPRNLDLLCFAAKSPGKSVIPTNDCLDRGKNIKNKPSQVKQTQVNHPMI